MRRVAMLLGTLGLCAAALAATPAPAEAHDGWWGYPAAREQAWRQHEWRRHHYWHPWYYDQGYYAPRPYDRGPGVTFGFNFR